MVENNLGESAVRIIDVGASKELLFMSSLPCIEVIKQMSESVHTPETKCVHHPDPVSFLLRQCLLCVQISLELD